MATARPTITTQGSSGRWIDDTRTPTTSTPGQTRPMGASFSYTGSNTPKIPLRPLRSSRNDECAPTLEIQEREHRSRFLTESEKLLLKNPSKTRESYREIESNTTEAGWHDHTIDQVLQQLQVDPERGLSSEDVRKRIARHGANTLETDKRAPVLVIFLMQFLNLIIGLLMAAALASIALQEYVEGIAIIAIVTLNAVIATIQENRAGNALDALAKMSSPQCIVQRNSRQQQITSDQLVPGDIVILTTGDVVPADIRLLASADFKVNEMILTGESEDVHKKYDADVSTSKKLTADNMVFASTAVSCGNATGIVVETGMGTRVGSIAALLKEDRRSKGANCLAQYKTKMTPLQEALHRLGVFMGLAVLTICAVVFAVGMIRGNHDPKNGDRPVWLTMVMVSVSLAVSAVPEGLPMVVTICLSTGTSEMVKKNVLVRKLAAVESLGASSVICTDKTGTLTEGKMTAIKAWGDNQEYFITGTGFDPNGNVLLDGVVQTAENNVQIHTTLLSAALCCNTMLQKEPSEDGTGSFVWTPFGNASEAPLVVAAAKLGLWSDKVGEIYPRIDEIPFTSSRKMMITVTDVPSDGKLGGLVLPIDSKVVAHVKGAPNYILPNCTRFVRTNGEIVEMTAEDRDGILEAVDELSSQALRVLTIAIHPMARNPFSGDEDVEVRFNHLKAPLIFLGLVASIDPPRHGVKEAIRTARMASIRTVMITGDYLKTAIAIAKSIDLLPVGADVDEEAVDCTILRPRGGEYLTEHDIDEITSRTAVFARAKPEDKIEIVKSLQRQGHVAAMTGDGVNDAPALKEADIGVAMGISGTEVAKGASDMILTDDNFCSIVAAVEKGRTIYTNIQKFVCFLLSTNFGEISIIFVAIAVGMPNPLEPLQILVLNIFADGMAAVALSLEKGDSMAMKERPRPKTQPIIHGRLWILVMTNAFLIGTGALIVFAVGLYWNFKNVLLDDILNGAKTVEDYKHVRCFRWQGVRAKWKMYSNCEAVYRDGSPVFPFYTPNMHEFDDDYVHCKGGDYECLTEGVARAQTMVFIYITTMEMFRAYTARSFTNHVFVGFFSNKYMQYAALGSITLTLVVTNTPYVMDELFGFAHIYWFQWVFSMLFAFIGASLGELLKCTYRRSDRLNTRWQHMSDGFDAVLLEIRNLRHHVEHLEDKLEVTTHRPARRLTLLDTSTTPGSQRETSGLLSTSSSASGQLSARLSAL
ncbi:hypothetical protein Poli38472_005570 [Pythium oligandrum]|uniref:Cation-transporting P-type ATPase N-terminal domain-containing protein n=1 Tax=Pythium oligandrum TaxID=41045 RepID=A0A8K1CIT5_PYTOL|nr:hypothetical protein Poli38472_005570 [Pythium oligandrum]|eukprot:TMW62952.1 hypothetical protein Poli38472_005570 [Pythium oligandrum]